MTTIDDLLKHTEKMRAYASQVDAYGERFKAFKGKTPMPIKTSLFTVYEATNGYFAETKGGRVVVGATLSEVCTAVQGALAEEKMLGEQEGGAQVPYAYSTTMEITR